jgi:hypothetical protein
VPFAVKGLIMAEALVVLPAYNKLLTECKGIFIKANKALVEAYWDLGKKLDDALGDGRAEYGAGTITKLAEDLRTDRRNLERARTFSRKFKKGDIAPGLGWTHYLALLPLPKDEAVTLAKKADEKKLSVKETKKEADKIKERKKFRGMPERKTAIGMDKLFNRLFAIPDPNEILDEYKGAEIEKKYYDRLVSKVEMAEERVKGLKNLIKKIKPVPNKEVPKKKASGKKARKAKKK